MLKRNLGYKILALGVAIVIWFYANEGQNPRITKNVNVSLQVRKVDPDCVVTNAPRLVRVVLEGARTHVESIAAEPDAVTAYVNLQGKSSGRFTLPVIVKLPQAFLSLVSAVPEPREAPIALEKRVRRTMTVDVQFIGSPPVGFRFSKPSVSPNRVSVSGTSRQISRASQMVVAVDTNDTSNGSIDDNFAVAALDADGKAVEGLALNPQKVHLRLELVEAPASRVVFISPEVSGQPPFPYKVSEINVEPQTISVTGRPEQLMNVTTIKTQPIQIAGHTKTFSQVVQVVAPRGLALTKGDSVRVTVRIVEGERPTSNIER